MTGFTHEYLPLVSDYLRALKSTARFTLECSPLVSNYSQALLMYIKHLYVHCNTRAFENNPRVIFEMCRGTPEDTSVFVNLVESCTVASYIYVLLVSITLQLKSLHTYTADYTHIFACSIRLFIPQKFNYQYVYSHLSNIISINYDSL